MTETTYKVLELFLGDLLVPLFCILLFAYAISGASIMLIEAWKKKRKTKVWFASWVIMVGIYFFIELIIRRHT